ncbi:MAG: beta-galactosidase [Planctomycetota bacterium]|nr:beta-galactosidase [Planctomycetota bacterium]
MNLGVQYYRPPFPLPKYWEDDFRRIKDSGLDTIQLWILWGWVEAVPGRFVYDDYDRLVELARKRGLKVVLSTIAEIQPYWVHREVPGSEMVTSQGIKVVSSNRGECHFGITPGGCTDHPGVWERMKRFLEETVRRYRSAPNLAGWDAWNELRWNVQADGLVCYCERTIAAFREWLDGKYGGLDGLNRAWLRRYGSWDDVWPGKAPDRPYTEMMAWEHFLTVRCDRHAAARYSAMKALDPKHPITVHAAEPCPGMAGGRENTAIDRGNDWAFADRLDGVGCSSFPKWAGMDDADFGMRVEFVKSAAQGKLVWLSEVQGGRSAIGFNVYKPVDAPSQQRWIWNGLACGADTILFWCWRDEVFGRESGGFGIVGRDGFAEERLKALRETGRILRKYRGLLEAYKPAPPAAGVLFSPQSYYLCWAQEATAKRAVNAIRAYAKSLVRRSIPYAVVEEEHLGAIEGLRILYMPRCIALPEEAERKIAEFVRLGGIIVCESECGAFDPQGIYRYPGDRWTAKLFGVEEVGRRDLAGQIEADFGGRRLRLEPAQWLTPMAVRGGAMVLAEHADGALLVEARAGKGAALLAGTYLGEAYMNQWTPDFEEFVETAARRAGWQPDIEILSPRPTKDAFLYVKSGMAGGRRVVFVFFPAGVSKAKLRFRKGFFRSRRLLDMISGKRCEPEKTAAGSELAIEARGWGIAVLVED